MFDKHARNVIDAIADIPGLEKADARRTLSWAYSEIVRMRIDATPAGDEAVKRADMIASLKGLAGALESASVFDNAHGVQASQATKEASAFVAAEALSLLSQLVTGQGGGSDPIASEATYVAIEAALLFLIGGYDANAASVAKGAALSSRNGPNEVAAEGHALATSILRLCQGNVGRDGHEEGTAGTPRTQPVLIATLLDDVRRLSYRTLRSAVDRYRAWLAGQDDQGADASAAACRRVRDATRKAPRQFVDLADVHHLAALLLETIESTRGRSVVALVPRPDGDPEHAANFEAYLRRRVVGSKGAPGRPLLWPSAREYSDRCLPGPSADAVVTMPTGSGKSFLAELAVCHALARGWVLYLAPTNTLAQQIRRDLSKALHPMDVEVTAFVGGSEYSTLESTEVVAGTKRIVAVMTPEKCALAMRLTPKIFARCALCVFDEFHLMNDTGSRGAVAEVVLTKLFFAAPQARLLLLSAMVANPKEIADWLTAARGSAAVPTDVRWKPTRTARGFVFVERSPWEAAKKESGVHGAHKPRFRAPYRTDVPLGAIVGLSGPWTDDGPADQRVLRLPISAGVERGAKRQGGLKDIEIKPPWKNGVGRALSVLFAENGLPAINFILSSRHHAFSSARELPPEKSLCGAAWPQGSPIPTVVGAWLGIANAELGVPSELEELMARGICVHTSAMLQVEQAAAEHMFKNEHALLMFATGTLAQGLNEHRQEDRGRSSRRRSRMVRE